MDWTIPIIAGFGGGVAVLEEMLNEEVMDQDPGDMNSSLHTFYEELQAIEQTMSRPKLLEFQKAIGILEDFLCICSYEGGMQVQNLFTLAMNVYNCGESMNGVTHKVSTPYLIQQTKTSIDVAIVSASKSKEQLEYVLPACDVLMTIIMEDSKPTQMKGKCNA